MKRMSKLVVMGLGVMGWAVGFAVAEDAPKAAAKGSDAPAATFGSTTVSLQDVDAKLLKNNMKLAQDLYNARKAALDDLLLEKFLEPEAKAKGAAYDQYLKEQLSSKSTPVSDADVEAWYNNNKARTGGKTLEQVADQIRSFLVTQKETDAKAALIKELKKKHGVKVTLDAPRIDIPISASEPSKGPADAKVTIVEYSDFQCPFCSKGAATVKQVQEQYADKVRIVFRDNAMAMHPRAAPAAEAAQCANEQGKFWEFHDKLFGDQKKMTDDDFKQYATDLGLDTEKFNACYSGGKYKEEVLKETNGTRDLGITGAPAFFINGRFLSGAQPIDAFKAIIEEELERAK